MHDRLADGHTASRAEATAVTISGLLAMGKFVVFTLTGSVAILASCADSLLDVSASTINWLAVRAAEAPPDQEHSYGHGKFEAVAGIFQAGVVAAAACYTMYAAVRRLLGPEPIDHVSLGIAMMVISTLASIAITVILTRAARRTGSLAVAGDVLHYTSDILANIGIIAALILESVTGKHFWDPTMAVIVTAYLLKAAWDVFAPAFDILVDHELDPEARQLIEETLQNSAPPEVVGYYGLRTRTSGRKNFADVRVVFHPDVPFTRVHDITEQMEAEVTSHFERAEVVIHPEPLGAHEISTPDLTWRK